MVKSHYFRLQFTFHPLFTSLTPLKAKYFLIPSRSLYFCQPQSLFPMKLEPYSCEFWTKEKAKLYSSGTPLDNFDVLLECFIFNEYDYANVTFEGHSSVLAVFVTRSCCSIW